MWLERNSQFYVYVTVLPTFLQVTPTIAGMLWSIRVESTYGRVCISTAASAQINIALASILAMTVTMSTVASYMPKTPSFTLLGYFVLAELFLCYVAMCIEICIGVYCGERQKLKPFSRSAKWQIRQATTVSFKHSLH